MTPPDNDPTVADADTLLRRIPNRPMMVAREADGRLRPSSAAPELREDESGCSVDILERTATPECPVNVMSGQDPSWGLASCSVRTARADDLHRVVGDPLQDNLAHALIVPSATSRAQQKRNFGIIARAMAFVREPELPL